MILWILSIGTAVGYTLIGAVFACFWGHAVSAKIVREKGRQELNPSNVGTLCGTIFFMGMLWPLIVPGQFIIRWWRK